MNRFRTSAAVLSLSVAALVLAPGPGRAQGPVPFNPNIGKYGVEKKSEPPYQMYKPIPGTRAGTAAQIVALTNAERAKAKLKPLQVNPVLTQVAQAHADNMARQQKMSHELDGKRADARLKAAGYNYGWYAENVAYNYPTADATVAGWMNSTKGHRENILSANAVEIGVGVAHDANGKPYYCQVFGKPR